MSSPQTPVVPSRSPTGTSKELPMLRVRTNPPPPSRWTMVREYNMAERDNYEEWKDNVSTQLDRMKKQMESYSDVIKTLDREMEEAKQRKQFYSCLRSGDDDDNDGETEAEEEMKADKETTSGETEKINMQEEKTKHKQIIVPTATTGTQTTTSQQTDNNNKS